MTRIVRQTVSEVPVQAVAPVDVPVANTVVATSNIKFEIEGTGVRFYETNEAINNKNVFENFDLARAGAIQAFAKHKDNVLAALNSTEKELLSVQDTVVQGAVPTVGVADPAGTPVARANSSNVTETPIL